MDKLHSGSLSYIFNRISPEIDHSSQEFLCCNTVAKEGVYFIKRASRRIKILEYAASIFARWRDAISVNVITKVNSVSK